MDEKSTNSQKSDFENAQENIKPNVPNQLKVDPNENLVNESDSKPTYMSPIDHEVDQDQDQKQLHKRKLSKIGLFIGLSILAYSIFQFIQASTCTGGFCGLSYGMFALMAAGVSLIFIIPSIAILVTSTKSYRDTTKRSKAGMIFGIIITIISILVSSYPVATIGRFLTDSSTAYNFINASMIFLGPLTIAGLLGIFMGLNITIKALRIKNIKMFTYLAFVIVIFGLISYGAYSFYSYVDEEANYIKQMDAEEKQYQDQAYIDADFIHTQASTIKNDASGQLKIYTNTYLGISITYPSSWILKNNIYGRDSTTLMTIASPEMAARNDIEAPYDVVLTYENMKDPTKTNDNLPIYLWREKEKGNNTYDYITNQYSERINSIDFIEYDANYFRYQCFAALFIKGDYIIGLGFDNTLNKSALEKNTTLYNILHSVELAP